MPNPAWFARSATDCMLCTFEMLQSRTLFHLKDLTTLGFPCLQPAKVTPRLFALIWPSVMIKAKVFFKGLLVKFIKTFENLKTTIRIGCRMLDASFVDHTFHNRELTYQHLVMVRLNFMKP